MGDGAEVEVIYIFKDILTEKMSEVHCPQF